MKGKGREIVPPSTHPSPPRVPSPRTPERANTRFTSPLSPLPTQFRNTSLPPQEDDRTPSPPPTSAKRPLNADKGQSPPKKKHSGVRKHLAETPASPTRNAGPGAQKRKRSLSDRLEDDKLHKPTKGKLPSGSKKRLSKSAHVVDELNTREPQRGY